MNTSKVFKTMISSSKQLAHVVCILSLLVSESWAESLIVYPCKDFEAIRWVRDSTFCDQYYICHFGQPLAMPSCPHGQVWSNGALNCVPRSSRWDDCSAGASVTSSETTPDLATSFTATQQPTSVNPSSTDTIAVSIKQLPSSRQEKSVIHLVFPEVGQRFYRLKDQGQPEAGQSSDRLEDQGQPEVVQRSDHLEDHGQPEVGQRSDHLEDRGQPEVGQHSDRLEDQVQPEVGQHSDHLEDRGQPEVGQHSDSLEDQVQPEVGQHSDSLEDQAQPEVGQHSDHLEDRGQPEVGQHSDSLEDQVQPEVGQHSDSLEDQMQPEVGQHSDRLEDQVQPEVGQHSDLPEGQGQPEVGQHSDLLEDQGQLEELATEDTSVSQGQDQILENNGHFPETTVPIPTSTEGHDIWTSTPWVPHEQRRQMKSQYEVKTSFSQYHLNDTLKHYNVDSEHECVRNPGILLAHPDKCHWYINCSLANLDDNEGYEGDDEALDDVGVTKEGFIRMEPFRVREAGAFVWECRYPQLFDDVTGRCREFMNVDCKSRFQPVDQCEYSVRQCTGGQCVPCERRFGRCRGRQNGVYPLHPTKWTPVFVTCYKERNIAQDECSQPTPIFSPQTLECVSLFDVPKQHGGFLPDCSTRPDGYYPDEQGRCAIFFRCSLGHFRGYDECPPGSVFDPAVPACQPYSYASKPCGEGQAPLCGGKLDGLYADPHGRCTQYFQCEQGLFQQYFTCDLGIFDPITQKCVIAAELTVRPCGLQPSPCEALPTGVYPDQATGCKHFIECHHGNMITNGTCESGTIFSAITGQCDLPEYAPPPCGVATTCIGRPDGRYPALSRGCSFFFECYHGEFISLRRCTEEDGGFFFNPETGSCDYPQNICPPCGYRWWGCPRTYQL